MKIFNWVHRKFNHKDGLAENAKKSGTVVAENYKQFEVEKALTTCNVFDGWKGGGILSIGTFGYDPLLKHIDQNINHVTSEEKEQVIEMINNYDESCHDDDDDYHHITSDQDEEEVNPLVYAAYNNNNYLHDDDDDDDNYEGLMETINPTTTTTVSPKDESMKKDRITLAELFYADSEEDIQMQKKQVSHKPAPQFSIKDKSSNSYKHRLSFAKKLIGDQDARPIHKLHRLIGRMLKRKIHPDADADADVGLDKHMTSCTTPLIFTSTHHDCEFASLLSTHQDTII